MASFPHSSLTLPEQLVLGTIPKYVIYRLKRQFKFSIQGKEGHFVIFTFVEQKENSKMSRLRG